MFYFFYTVTATTEIYTLSLHDALPIFLVLRHLPRQGRPLEQGLGGPRLPGMNGGSVDEDRGIEKPLSRRDRERSEEHTSELQSQSNLVCRLLLEKKKTEVNRFSALCER